MLPDGEEREFTKADKDKVEEQMHAQAKRTMKLLSVAKISDGKTVLMAVLCLRDNVRTDAVETVQILNDAGIQVVMVTGDAEETAVAIAKEAGILADEKKLLGVIKEEIQVISDKYGDDRRTSIGFDEFDMSAEDLIPNDETIVAMTKLGYIKRMSKDNFKSQNRGGKGIKGMQTIDEDYIEDLILTKNHNYIMFFTNTGRVYRLKAYAIPEAGRTARGTAIVNLIQLLPGEKITAIISMKEYDDEKFLFMATRNGMVKKTPMREYANVRKTGLQAIVLRENDELIEVKATDNQRDIFMVTKFGKSIRFHETDVRVTGRVSMGVIGMNLDDGDEIIGMQMDSQGETLLVVSENGIGKRTDISEFPIQKRGGKGVLCYKIVEKTGYLVGAKLVHEDHDIMMITNEGIVIRISVKDISIIGRNTSGVKLMNIDPNSNTRIASIAKVRDDEQNPEVEDAIDEQETEEASTDTE